MAKSLLTDVTMYGNYNPSVYGVEKLPKHSETGARHSSAEFIRKLFEVLGLSALGYNKVRIYLSGTQINGNCRITRNFHIYIFQKKYRRWGQGECEATIPQ